MIRLNKIDVDVSQLKTRAILYSHMYNKHHKIIKIKSYTEASKLCSQLTQELTNTECLFKIWVKCGFFTNNHSIIIKFYEPTKYKDYLKSEFNKLFKNKIDENYIKIIVREDIIQKNIAKSLAHNYNIIFGREYSFDYECYEMYDMDGNKIELYRVFTY
jgi:hypothetical protein